VIVARYTKSAVRRDLAANALHRYKHNQNYIPLSLSRSLIPECVKKHAEMRQRMLDSESALAKTQ